MSDDDQHGWVHHITGWNFLNARPKRLGVAVSGGSDSMALLDLMIWHGNDLGVPVEVVTVDHGLRPEAAEEAAFVARHCAERDVPHTVLTWETWDGKGNLQAEARDARYRLIAEWAASRDVDVVALGHTTDDVAETFLLRLARASGVDGLAELKRDFERFGLRWIRPILAQDREQWREYLRERGIGWVEDPSNEDDTFDRVKARRILKELQPLGIDANTLSTVAVHMSSARWALEDYTWKESKRLVKIELGDVVVTRNPMPPVSGEIDRRLVNAAIQWVSGAPYAPRYKTFVDMEAAFSLGSDTHTLSGCLANLSKPEWNLNQKLRITREYNAVKDVTSSTKALWDGRWSMSGTHAADLEVRALGEAVKDVPDWRETGLPRPSLLASPAIWRGATLVAAPVAGFKNGWEASATGRGTFDQFLLSR